MLQKEKIRFAKNKKENGKRAVKNSRAEIFSEKSENVSYIDGKSKVEGLFLK